MDNNKTNAIAEELIDMIDKMQANKKSKVKDNTKKIQNKKLDEYFKEAEQVADNNISKRILEKERKQKMAQEIAKNLENIVDVNVEENNLNKIYMSDTSSKKIENAPLYFSTEKEKKEQLKELVFTEINNEPKVSNMTFSENAEKREDTKTNYNPYKDVKIKFDSEKGKYRLYEDRKFQFESSPVKIGFLNKDNFKKIFKENEGRLYSKEVTKIILDIMDPTVYLMLKHYDKDNFTNKASEYVEDIKVNNLTNVEYDLRKMNGLKKLGLFDKLRIKLMAQKQENLNIAQVKRSNNSKGLKRFVATFSAILGITAIGATATQISHDDNTVENNVAYADETTPANDENEKIEEKYTYNVKPQYKKSQNEDSSFVKYTKQVSTINKNNETKTKKEDNKESVEEDNIEEFPEVEEIDLKNIAIGKEVVLTADKLFGSCEEQSKVCNVNKLIGENKNVKITAGRIAVKTPNGYAENTKLEGTTINELKEKYGEENEYWLNLNIEVDGVKYSSVGWTSLDNLQIKEKEKTNDIDDDLEI